MPAMNPTSPAAPTPPAQPAPLTQYVPYQSAPAVFEKPGMVTAIGVLTLISGVLNILAGLAIAGGLALSVIGICIAPFGVLPIVLGVFEILYAMKLMSNPPQPVQPNQTIAILEIVCFLFGNVLSGIVGVLALVFYSDTNVKAYFARLAHLPQIVS